MKRIFFGVGSLASLLMGCATVPHSQSVVARRASWELQCPESQVGVKTIDGNALVGTYAANGCGKSATYAVRCTTTGQVCEVVAAGGEARPTASPYIERAP